MKKMIALALVLVSFSLPIFAEHVVTYGSNLGYVGGKLGKLDIPLINKTIDMANTNFLRWDLASIGYEYFPSRTGWVGFTAHADGTLYMGAMSLMPDMLTGIVPPSLGFAVGGGVTLGAGVAFRIVSENGRYTQFSIGPFYRFAGYAVLNDNKPESSSVLPYIENMTFATHTLGLSLDAYFNFPQSVQAASSCALIWDSQIRLTHGLPTTYWKIL